MFETSDAHSKPELRPLRVASRREGIYEEAKDMVADLANWRVVSADEASCTIVCERKGGLVGGTSKVTIRVDGPDGIPSATVNVRAESQSGLFVNDKSVVLEFMKPFTRRVC